LYSNTLHLKESTVTIEEVELVEILGTENKNIKAVALAFPKAKLVSRGNEIKIKADIKDTKQLLELFEMLFSLAKKGTLITPVLIQDYIQQKNQPKVTELETHYDADVLLYGNRGLIIRIKTDNQRKLVKAIEEHDLVFATGPAGTGKTYTAVALAVKALKDKQVKKIIFTRPAVEAGENLGFLPGDLKEKLDPYLRPIYDALEDMIPLDKLKYLIENNIIEIAPLAYMRGRTLNNAFIILDEAQNTTPLQLKMFLTRMGPNSKVFITGDKSQVDLPTKQKSGLNHAIGILKSVKEIAFVELDGSDVLRHKLVRNIINAYDKDEAGG
jgi:phosphate starvation-inducible protein PhoH and related proteins